MNFFRQIVAITVFGFSSLPSRWGSSSTLVVGLAGVVSVFLGMLTLSSSLTQTFSASVRPDRVFVLSKGARFEANSLISLQDVAHIQALPGVRRSQAGHPIVSAETLVPLIVHQKLGDEKTSITVRGISPIAFDLRPEIELTAGRKMRSGLKELLVGREAQSRYKGLAIGDYVTIRGSQWRVVGSYRSNGDPRESEVLADGLSLLAAYKRDGVHSVSVQLDGVESLSVFRDALSANPELHLDIVSEQQYAERQSQDFASLLASVGYLAGCMLGLGASFAAMNSMYTAITVRQTEIATLRVLGFAPSAIVLSVLLEALLLVLLGATIGIILVESLIDGQIYGNSSVLSRLQLSTEAIWTALGLSCLIGLLGGSVPAVRAGMIPLARVLRES